MENKNTHIPKYDREPSMKSFKRTMWRAMVFIAIYGVVLIWKNYYMEGAVPPLERKQLSVPSYFEGSDTTYSDSLYQ